MSRIYVRSTGKYRDIVQFGQGALKFLYGNPVGRVLLRLAVSPIVSDLYRIANSTKKSTGKIPKFIEDNKIRMEDFEDREYLSFNDFFTRKIREGARPIDADPSRLISPADSKMLVLDIDEKTGIFVKGREYTLDELVGDRTDVHEYYGGKCIVYRLCMDDYHRYCFIDNGRLRKRFTVKGKLHTVSPVSEGHKIYKENTRVISILDTENFGKVIHVEVGALLVGRIVNRDTGIFKKGEEKGYFEPGGSTIIQIFRKESVEIDEDILKQSRDGIETEVRYGEGVGTRC